MKQVTTKFYVGQLVYVIFDNTIQKLEVKRIDICIAPRYNTAMRCNTVSALTIYSLDTGKSGQMFQQYEDKVFATKKELIDSL